MYAYRKNYFKLLKVFKKKKLKHKEVTNHFGRLNSIDWNIKYKGVGCCWKFMLKPLKKQTMKKKMLYLCSLRSLLKRESNNSNTFIMMLLFSWLFVIQLLSKLCFVFAFAVLKHYHFVFHKVQFQTSEKKNCNKLLYILQWFKENFRLNNLFETENYFWPNELFFPKSTKKSTIWYQKITFSIISTL